jgi:hypothetical protein
MATPIIVIGKYRSGTKWLSNLIAGHPDVTCIAHDAHFGILEASDVFQRLPMIFGNLTIPENFIGFMEYYASTDFFRLTGLEKKLFYENRPKDYLEFFRRMMDVYSEKENRRYWVQKADTYALEKLLKQYDDGKFIMIIRDPKDNVRSALALAMGVQHRRNKRILHELYMYYLEKKRIEACKNRKNVMILSFKDVQRNREETIPKVCQFIGIEYTKEMLTSRFKQNTSYKGDIRKDEIFSSMDEFLFALFTPVFNAMPQSVFEWTYRIKTTWLGYSFLRSENRRLNSFKLLKRELDWD